MIMKQWFIFLIFCLLYYPAQAELTINNSNNFMGYQHFNPQADINKNLLLISSKWAGITLSIGNLYGLSANGNANQSFFTNPPLVYPSPFNLRDGGTLGYGLSRNDISLDFHIYDMFGYEVLQKEFKPNQVGGYQGYNSVILDNAFFNNKSLPAGVYFFVFLENDELLAKGKFAVIP